MYRETVDNCPTIVSRLKEKGADSEARTIAEAIASLDNLVADEDEAETPEGPIPTAVPD